MLINTETFTEDDPATFKKYLQEENIKYIELPGKENIILITDAERFKTLYY